MPAFLKKGFRVWGLGFILIMFVFLYPIPYTLYPTYADWTLDLTPPTTTFSATCGISANCTSGSTSTITITCTDTSGSGCSGSEYSFTSNAGPWSTYSAVSKPTATSSTTIYARSTDNAGNTSSAVSQAITFSGAPSFDFSMSNSGSITITPGQVGSNTITATFLSGTTQAVTFSPTAGPFGSTIAYSVNPCSPTCSPQPTLTISNTGGVPAGTYLITVTGTASGGLQHSTPFNLIVNAAPNNLPSCTLINGPTVLNPGVTGSYTVNATDSDGSIASTNWTASGGSPTTGATTFNLPFSWSSAATGNFTMNATVTDNLGGTAACPAKTVSVSFPAWIQTTGGDVHSNTGINTPGGP